MYSENIISIIGGYDLPPSKDRGDGREPLPYRYLVVTQGFYDACIKAQLDSNLNLWEIRCFTTLSRWWSRGMYSGAVNTLITPRIPRLPTNSDWWGCQVAFLGSTTRDTLGEEATLITSHVATKNPYPLGHSRSRFHKPEVRQLFLPPCFLDFIGREIATVVFELSPAISSRYMVRKLHFTSTTEPNRKANVFSSREIQLLGCFR